MDASQTFSTILADGLERVFVTQPDRLTTIVAMLKRMDTSLARRCIAQASQSPRATPGIHYPRWYLQRWHFLPEGYLSRRSAAAYETLIRRLYNVTREGAVLDRLTGYLRASRPESVLELGCGPGRALERVSKVLPHSKMTGVDLSPFMLERAAERTRANPHIDLIHADGGALPWSAPAFDAAVAIHYFGHLPASFRSTALTAAQAAIRPGGRLYVVDHGWHPPLGQAFQLADRVRFVFRSIVLSVYEPAPMEVLTRTPGRQEGMPA
jgi:SAM-dependent methyltransferase